MKRTMSNTLNKIYLLVKDKKIVDIFTFCDMLNLGPSTFYNYAKFVSHRYENVIYEEGKLKWVETEVINE